MKHNKLISSLIVQICTMALCINAFAHDTTSFTSFKSKQQTDKEVEYCSDNKNSVETFTNKSVRKAAAKDVAVNSLVYSESLTPDDPYGAFYINYAQPDDIIYLAFCIEKKEIRNFIGSEISSINITTGTDGNGGNPISDVTVFITQKPGNVPIVRQQATLGPDEFTSYSVELDTPYKIEEESRLYIGYYFTVPESGGYYVPYDMETSNKLSNLVVVGDENWPSAGDWENYTPQYGNLCMSITLKGEKLPENCALIRNTVYPDNVGVGAEWGYSINFTNKGAGTIDNIEVQTLINQTAYSQHIGIDNLPSGSSCNVWIPGTVIPQSGIYYIETTISKVNGKENLYSDIKQSVRIACFDDGFTQNAVVEEATGTWCGYCPRGIVMCEYIRENYADRIFPIAVHQGDVMAIPEYEEFISEFVEGFPSAFANRKENVEVSTYGADWLYNNIKDKKSYANIDLTAKVEGNFLNIRTQSKFALDTEIEHRIAFAVVEDGVGPYIQTNYYGLGSGLGLWDTAGGSVSMEFNDVARQLDSYEGIGGSLPGCLKNALQYEYTHQMDISRVSSQTFRVIAMILNCETGEIVNASQFTVVPEGKLYLNKSNLALTIGQESRLTATVGGKDMDDVSVTWSSKDPNIAEVSEEGLVKAMAQGETCITASYGEETAECNVNVSLIGGNVYVDDIRYYFTSESTCSVAMPEVEGSYMMESVVIPPSINTFGREFTVTEIAEGAFSLSPNLKSVELPTTITQLQGWAFNGCVKLQKINIPSSVWLINSCAFQACHELEELTLEEGLEVIWTHAFAFCEKFENIAMPSTIKELGPTIFYGIDLKSLTCKSIEPPYANGDLFAENMEQYDICELFVPTESIEKYNKAPVFRNFSKITGIEIEDEVEQLAAGVSTCDIYSANGLQIARNVKLSDVRHSLIPGIYIIRNTDGTTSRLMIRR